MLRVPGDHAAPHRGAAQVSPTVDSDVPILRAMVRTLNGAVKCSRSTSGVRGWTSSCSPLSLATAGGLTPGGSRRAVQRWAPVNLSLIAGSKCRRVGRIFVVRTDDGLIVKRAGRDRTGAWQLVSDNPSKRTWPTVRWPADAPVIGEVKWVARTFV